MSNKIEEDLQFFEFDAITLHREDVEQDIGRSLTDDEWYEFIDKVAWAIDDVSWKAINNIEKEMRKIDGAK